MKPRKRLLKFGGPAIAGIVLAATVVMPDDSFPIELPEELPHNEVPFHRPLVSITTSVAQGTSDSSIYLN